VPIEYTLDAQDVAAARLLAIGIRPRIEFSLFAAVLCGLVALSVVAPNFGSVPLLIGLTACLGAFRLTQINKVKQAATAAFNRNQTLRQPTVASWNDDGITIQPAAATMERIPWGALGAFKENERVVLFQQKSGAIHAIPKRAFTSKDVLAQLRRKAHTETGRSRRPS
jgi:YcxB-like protein